MESRSDSMPMELLAKKELKRVRVKRTCFSRDNAPRGRVRYKRLAS
jgi:hypothetical protein